MNLLQFLATDYSLTLPVWGWCLAVPVLGVVTAWVGYFALEGLAWLGWKLSRILR